MPLILAERMDIHRIYARIGRRFRRNRMANFVESFGITSETTVLDVGGTLFNWTLIEQSPKVLLVNLDQGDVIGDATCLPFRDRSFEVVYSNSVIEHLGTHANQEAFSREVRRVGRHFYVQTPNKHFPIEPHYLTPFVQYLPTRARARIMRHLTVWGWIVRSPYEENLKKAQGDRLLTRRQLQTLFPNAELKAERFLGLVKSWMAEG